MHNMITLNITCYSIRIEKSDIIPTGAPEASKIANEYLLFLTYNKKMVGITYYL